MMRASRTRLVGAAVVVAVALVTSACSGAQTAGSAATIGDTRISEQDLADQVGAVLTAQGLPADSDDASLTSTTLGRMITIELVRVLAEQEGVVITQGQIDQQLATFQQQAGSQEAVESTFAQQGIAPNEIEDVLRINLEATALGEKLLPDGSVDEQGQAVFDAVGSLSDDLQVEVSPRFGTWDATTLRVTEAEDDVATLPSSDG